MLLSFLTVLTTTALAGSFEGEVALDYLGATSRDDTGTRHDAGELGLRTRGSLSSDDGWRLRWDYRGRQPVHGTDKNSPMHLLYFGEASKSWGQTATVGLGRFVAPSIVLLPVDGAHVRVTGGPLTATAFGGRRAISTSRRNIPLGRFLPAGGAIAALRLPWLRADAGFALYQDDLVLGTPDAGIEEPYTTWNTHLSVVAMPTDTWTLGGRFVLAPWISYTFTSSTQLAWTVEAASVYDVAGFVRWRPHDRWRVGVDALLQHALVESTVAQLLDPSFVDLRAHAAYRVPHLGWMRARFVERLRTDRTETRARLEAQVNELIPPFFEGAIEVVGIGGDGQPDDIGFLDRLYWNLGVGYRGKRLEASVGLAYTERAATPVSGLSGDLQSPSPTRSEDLALFTLEAQSTFYLRAFYVDRVWFAGVDVERSVLDNEYRGMAQVGARWDAGW